jgi:transposase
MGCLVRFAMSLLLFATSSWIDDPSRCGKQGACHVPYISRRGRRVAVSHASEDVGRAFLSCRRFRGPARRSRLGVFGKDGTALSGSATGKGYATSAMPQHCEAIAKAYDSEAENFKAMAQAHRDLTKAAK